LQPSEDTCEALRESSVLPLQKPQFLLLEKWINSIFLSSLIATFEWTIARLSSQSSLSPQPGNRCGRAAPQFSVFAQAKDLQELRATGRTNTNVPAQGSKNSQR
jgi:hypothetical protein